VVAAEEEPIAVLGADPALAAAKMWVPEA